MKQSFILLLSLLFISISWYIPLSNLQKQLFWYLIISFSGFKLSLNLFILYISFVVLNNNLNLFLNNRFILLESFISLLFISFNSLNIISVFVVLYSVLLSVIQNKSLLMFVFNRVLSLKIISLFLFMPIGFLLVFIYSKTLFILFKVLSFKDINSNLYFCYFCYTLKTISLIFLFAYNILFWLFCYFCYSAVLYAIKHFLVFVI